MSRIDVPARRNNVPVGRLAVAGIAFAGDRGIARVEVSVDDGGTWAEAVLLPEFGPLAWRFWSHVVEAASDEFEILVRATDGGGAQQVEEMRAALPDGATGWHTIQVQVA